MLALGLEALAQFGVEASEIRIGDVGLFTALIAALDLPPAWRRRLAKDFHRTASLAHDLDRLRLDAAQSGPEYQGLLAALAGSDLRAAHALVTDLLSIAGITTVGGRSVGEIADRFLEQAALGGSARLPQQTQDTIERFLKIAGNPDDAIVELRALEEDTGVTLAPAIDVMESRTGFLAAQGIDVSRMRFATAFGRGVDYYTGFVFEIHDAQARVSGQLVGGGRYDALLSRLGAKHAIPAVGFAVWIDRLQAIGTAP
jgi:ATP phosphoribosyltransferase regulatory subunit